jgi:bacterioferritin
MKGHSDILAKLNELLTHELSSADLYLAFSRALQRKGYTKLYERLAHEAEDEMRHAQMLTERILLLEGTPDVITRLEEKPATDPKGILEMALRYELDVAKMLNETIALCDQHRDAGTRTILEVLLKDTEEDHIDYLEAQLHLIGEVGLENYLAKQL